MTSHELAKKLLDGPDIEVVINTGEDSRDNICYQTVEDIYLISGEDFDIDQRQILGIDDEEEVIELTYE